MTISNLAYFSIAAEVERIVQERLKEAADVAQVIAESSEELHKAGRKHTDRPDPKGTHRFYMIWRRDGRYPRRRHPNLGSAVYELARLSSLYPDKKFYILSAFAKLKEGKIELYPVKDKAQ